MKSGKTQEKKPTLDTTVAGKKEDTLDWKQTTTISLPSHAHRNFHANI